ncbi:MAG: MoxR family ATPase [Bdellovibrionales bacterium]|nr:MoxR family ATPase [Bdellovibrionales bacterium]
MQDLSLSAAKNTIDKVFDGLCNVIKGREDTIKLLISALIADGHVLLEDYPGSGKTTLTKTLGGLISSDDQSSISEHILPFRRIQFTPDMLPGDVLGVNVFDPQTGKFHFNHGPVFAHVVLADEINRTGPKVQAAFLECMAEKQVTTDNQTHKLDDLFFVVGTQNPLDMAGTYPLPLVQLDRFLLKVPMTYVDANTEFEILSTHDSLVANLESIKPVCTRTDILNARKAAKEVNVSKELRQTIVQIIQATRNNPQLQFGASTRAAIMLQNALKAWALVNGKDFVSEDDLKFLSKYVLMHRLKFHSAAGDPHKALEELMTPYLENLIAA